MFLHIYLERKILFIYLVFSLEVSVDRAPVASYHHFSFFAPSFLFILTQIAKHFHETFSNFALNRQFRRVSEMKVFLSYIHCNEIVLGSWFLLGFRISLFILGFLFCFWFCFCIKKMKTDSQKFGKLSYLVFRSSDILELHLAIQKFLLFRLKTSWSFLLFITRQNIFPCLLSARKQDFRPSIRLRAQLIPPAAVNSFSLFRISCRKYVANHLFFETRNIIWDHKDGWKLQD